MTNNKTFKQLVTSFNFDKPDFTEILPYLTGKSEANLENFEGNLVGKWNGIKTLWQLSKPEKPVSRSRVWASSDGYIHLVSWSNASLLRVLGVKWFQWFKFDPTSPLKSSNPPAMGYKLLDRLEGQFLDELRSIVANIEEGFARPQTSSYLDFIGYSQGSLKEAKGEVQRLRQDGFLPSIQGSALSDLGIELKDWHQILKKTVISKPFPLKSSKSPLNSFKFNHPSIDNLDPSKLTYEMYLELINKTDWNLRRLVKSLEKKLDDERMYFKVERSRIKGNAVWKEKN